MSVWKNLRLTPLSNPLGVEEEENGNRQQSPGRVDASYFSLIFLDNCLTALYLFQPLTKKPLVVFTVY